MLADMAKELPDFPPAWVSAPRQAAGYVPPASTAFNWILKEDQLKELYSGNKVLCRPTIYANGHWLEGFAKSFVDPGEDGLQYSLGVGIELPPAVYGCQTSLRIFITVLAGEEVSKASHCCSLILSSGHGRGFRLKRKRPSIQELVTPYLVDNQVVINYEISNVDAIPMLVSPPEAAPITPLAQVWEDMLKLLKFH